LKTRGRDVPVALGEELIEHYLDAFPELDEGAFRISYAVIGAQRSTRIIGTFSRLKLRDSKPGYLAHIPASGGGSGRTQAPGAGADRQMVRPAHPARPAHRASGARRMSLIRVPDRAMVLAAGKGVRLRPLTLTKPKPLVPVDGRPMLDMVLDRLAEIGVEEAVVNTHHLGHMIEGHLRPRERPRNPHLARRGAAGNRRRREEGSADFWANAVLRSKWRCSVARRQDAYPVAPRRSLDDAIMDALLLLQPTASAIGYEGNGDFVMDQLGRLRRRREGEIAPFLFAGLQILKPSLFTDTPEGPFSLNLLYDRALSGGRLYGLRHDGSWYHVGTPEDLQRVEAALRPGSEQVF
jgi:MurNAc alpha-1-phosphate uridylyltransferase